MATGAHGGTHQIRPLAVRVLFSAGRQIEQGRENDMEWMITELNETEMEDIENRLERYDHDHITYKVDGRIRLGIKAKGRLVAGADACFTAYHILYISTMFVDEAYRRKGIGRALLTEIENQAILMGAKTVSYTHLTLPTNSRV